MLSATPAAAQQLELKRSTPRVAWAGCGPAAPRPTVTPPQQREAAALADSATQAALLGNTAAAANFLANAARLNPTSDAIAYRYARALEELNRREDALAGYCRFVALSRDADDAAEARERIAALADTTGVSAAAAQDFRTGIDRYDLKQLLEAEAAFGRAFEAAPNWGDAVYNRGVVRLAQGNQAGGAADLRRYLELSPGASDLGTIVDALARYGSTTAAAPPRYNPSAAFLSGMLVPGLGHFTTGRPAMGALLLGVAAAGVVGGLMVEKTDVVCLSPPVNGSCPPDQVLREEVTRPYLVPGLAVAGAAAILGAIDAARGASRRNAEAASALRVGSSTLQPPAIQVGRNGAQLELVRLRF